MRQHVQRKHRLLVVDDDADFRQFVKTTLAEEDFEVADVSSGPSALTAVKEKDFDLILLDIRMPSMNGVQALKLLRQDSPASDFVVITGYQDLALAIESVKLGAKEYLTKPVEPLDLIQRVKSVLRVHDAELQLKDFQSEFTSRLLHELRTPLQTVKSAVGFLKKDLAGPTTDQQQDVLNHIEINVGKMSALVNDMIDLTKFESGKVDLEKLPTNLDELIPAICSRYEPQVRAKNLTLSVDVNSSIPTLELDSDKIEQVISNLIDNAIKYTPDGGNIVISAAPVQEDVGGKTKEWIGVAVKDSGIGITKEELPFVFDKYKEFLTGKSSQQKTTGIGLAICRSIVEAHKGVMIVESERGRGSTFKLYLPAE